MLSLMATVPSVSILCDVDVNCEQSACNSHDTNKEVDEKQLQ